MPGIRLPDRRIANAADWDVVPQQLRVSAETCLCQVAAPGKSLSEDSFWKRADCLRNTGDRPLAHREGFSATFSGPSAS